MTEGEREIRKMFYKINEKEKLQFQAHEGLNELITKQISVHYHNFVAPRKKGLLNELWYVEWGRWKVGTEKSGNLAKVIEFDY